MFAPPQISKSLFSCLLVSIMAVAKFYPISNILATFNFFLAPMYLHNSNILRCCGLMWIIFTYRAGNLMSPFNIETPVLQIWTFFLIISVMINSVTGFFPPFFLFLFLIHYLDVACPRFVPYYFSFILFFCLILLINWRNSSPLFPYSFDFFHLCCHVFHFRELCFVP